MNDKASTTVKFVLEIHRYSRPEEIFSFFAFNPTNDPYQINSAFPFDTGDEHGQPYEEIDRVQVREDLAKIKREDLIERGFMPLDLNQARERLGEVFTSWVIHCQAPIEWHRGLDAKEPEVFERVTVWVEDRS